MKNARSRRAAVHPGSMFYHFHGAILARLAELYGIRRQVRRLRNRGYAPDAIGFQQHLFLKGYGPRTALFESTVRGDWLAWRRDEARPGNERRVTQGLTVQKTLENSWKE
jgi:hypothetical protein